MNNAVIISEKDNVAVALKEQGSIPAGHKFALCDIKKDEEIIKYGAVIGKATRDIEKGQWVHSHNMKTALCEEADYKYSFSAAEQKAQNRSFKGFKRQNRRAGIRNEIYIIPTVGCVNGVCLRLQKEIQGYIKGSVDGVFALTHQFGCSQLGEDNENIKNLICAIAQNPNASYVLIVGLGCENNRLCEIKKALEPFNDDGHIAFFNAQDVEDEIEYGSKILKDFIERASALKREDIDFSELCIGLKCGGSDGFSGITANPLVGKISDRVVSLGGSAVLTEVPEMFGAEQRLMNKCENEEIFLQYKKMIEDFKGYYTKNGFPIYENPSPGNKEGGITTLEEKSLGCVEKAGSTKIVDVLSYGETLRKSGVSVLNAPGNDLIAATALASAGCQIVLFTTGRGTPFSTFVPTLKIASNTLLSNKKGGWIDFCAESMDENGLFSLIEDVINGDKKVKSEDVREIAFYKTGVTL